MTEERLLRSATSWQSKGRPGAGRLGESVDSYLKSRAGDFTRGVWVQDAWRTLLPEELLSRCSIAGVKAAALIVEVEPGPYMHELRALSRGLVEGLRSRCPRAGIRKIKLLPRRQATE